MNRSKFIKKSLLFVVLILMFLGFIPTILAKAPYSDIPKDQNIGWPIWWDDDGEPGINAAEESYFRVGLIQSPEEKESGSFPGPPYNIRLYINDEEIRLKKYTGITVDKIPIYQFYEIFEPGYFNPENDYIIIYELWVLRPYQGDGLNEWRIYFDYYFVYGNPEDPTYNQLWVYEYDLIFEQ